MHWIQPGCNVLSLFGIAKKQAALNKKIANHGLIASLVSAFFIILAVSLILSAATRVLGNSRSLAAATLTQEEKVAFTPGQFVSEEINRGYLQLR